MNIKPTFSEKIKSLHIKDNLGLKILALIISFVLWIIVVNITDPVSSATYRNVPVRFVNNNLKEQGKTLEVLNGSDNIETIVIKAPRSVIRELSDSKDNIEAIADFNRMNFEESHVPIEFVVAKYSDKIENIKASHMILDVKVENRKSVQKPITASVSGEVAEGYVIGDIKTAHNQIKITGPESVVNKIDRACVDVQVTGFTENISTVSEIVLYDAEGNEVTDVNLDININRKLSVDVEILASKSVPVNFNISGTPDENSALTGELFVDKEYVTIAGKQAAIDAIAAINVPSSVLNVSGLKTSLNAAVDINDYLPAGIRLAESNFDGKINVTVVIEEFKEEKYSVYLQNVDIQSGPDGFDIEWGEKNDYIDFVLVGLAKDLENLKLDELDYHVDFGDYSIENNIDTFKTGLYELSLNLNLPEGVKLKEPVTITIALKRPRKN